MIVSAAVPCIAFTLLPDRIVETLFISEERLLYAAPEWHALRARRNEFLSHWTVTKYLSDAAGQKGLRLLSKYRPEDVGKPKEQLRADKEKEGRAKTSEEAAAEAVEKEKTYWSKLHKTWYIVFR